MIGSGGLAVLLAIVAASGPALTRVPLNIVQLAVGTLLPWSGMRCCASDPASAGVIPLHDEEAAYGRKPSRSVGRGGEQGPGHSRHRHRSGLLEGLGVSSSSLRSGRGLGSRKCQKLGRPDLVVFLGVIVTDRWASFQRTP